MRGSQYLGVAVALSLAGASAGEIIGPWDIQSAPIAATEIVGGGPIWDWLNVVNEPITINEAFSGFSIIADGYANGASGTIVEMEFAPGTARNIAGPDLVMFDSRFSSNSYAISTDFDGFATELALPNTAFSDTGVDRDYFYRGTGPFSADIMAAPIDLSDFGVPLGGEVTFVRFRITSSEGDPLGIGSLFVPVVDQDSDGIPDDEDACPESILTATIIIDGCDSGVANLLFEDGCTMADLIAECAEGAVNHGQFVSCVAHLTNEWKRAGLIEGQEEGLVERCAARSDIPGDLDGDGAVGVADLVMLLGEWGPCPGRPDTCPADVDLDDIVGITDLLILLANWG